MKSTTILGLLLLIASRAFACDCAQKPSIITSLNTCDRIFSGKVIQKVKVTILPADTVWSLLDTDALDEPMAIDYYKVTISIEDAFSGIKRKSKTVEVYTPAATSACGYVFQIGKRYIIYGYSLKLNCTGRDALEGVRTSTCERTDVFNIKEKRQLLKKTK